MREQIDLLEDKTQSLSKNEKITLAIFLPLATFALFYFLYIPDALEEQTSNKNALVKLNKDLHKYSEKLVLHKIQALKQTLLHVKNSITEKKQQLTYLETKLANSDFLFLTQKDFTHFLNDLLTKSVKNNFLLDNINISKNNNDFIGKLKYKKTIKVSGSAEFLNTLKFLRGIEKNSMLMQIRNLNIETNGSIPSVSFTIKFYGIKQ